VFVFGTRVVGRVGQPGYLAVDPREPIGASDPFLFGAIQQVVDVGDAILGRLAPLNSPNETSRSFGCCFWQRAQRAPPMEQGGAAPVHSLEFFFAFVLAIHRLDGACRAGPAMLCSLDSMRQRFGGILRQICIDEMHACSLIFFGPLGGAASARGECSGACR
jgi:hypothetical protein